MRIWKWTLSTTDLQILDMPEGAQLLTVQTQGDRPQLWALVNDTPPIKWQRRRFRIYGTGHEMPNNPGKYVATYQILDGQLVFHVFEVA